MRKVLLGVLCLVAFVLVLASCDRSVPVIEPEAGGGSVGGVPMVRPPSDMKMYLLWTGFDAAAHVEHTWPIPDPEEAYTLTWTPEGWGDGFEFKLEIPAMALPSYVDAITLRVCAKDVAHPEYPPVYEFVPDVDFLGEMEAAVTLYYPPWLTASQNGAYAKYCFWPEYPGSNNFAYSDWDVHRPDTPAGRRIRFSTGHFSRWASEPADRP